MEDDRHRCAVTLEEPWRQDDTGVPDGHQTRVKEPDGCESSKGFGPPAHSEDHHAGRGQRRHHARSRQGVAQVKEGEQGQAERQKQGDLSQPG